MEAGTITSDRERVQELVGALRGRQLDELDRALAEDRDGTIRLAEQVAASATCTNPPAAFSAALRRGEHKRRMRVMSTDEGTGPPPAARADPAEALRRLYDAKIDQLRQVGVPEPQRIMVAVDYACGEIWKCSIGPMPVGGIGKLEDDLYRAIGCDRFTGVRFAPR